MILPRLPDLTYSVLPVSDSLLEVEFEAGTRLDRYQIARREDISHVPAELRVCTCKQYVQYSGECPSNVGNESL